MANKEQESTSGTSQNERGSQFLAPTYAIVETRGLQELLTYLQKLASQILYYDQKDFDRKDPPNADWGDFLTYGEQRQKEFISDILTHAKDPTAFVHDRAKFESLTRPHLVLLLAFLHLLRHARSQINALTSEHLNLLYTKVLGFELLPPQVDRLHVILSLGKDRQEHLLKRGTLLSAGKDSLGRPLQYALRHDLVLNRARIARLHTMFLDLRWDTFEKTAEKVWGELPSYKGAKVGLEKLKNMVQSPQDSDLGYIQNYLGLSSFEALHEIVSQWTDQEARPAMGKLEPQVLSDLYQERFRRQWQAQILAMVSEPKNIQALVKGALQPQVYYVTGGTNPIQDLWAAYKQLIDSGKQADKTLSAYLSAHLGLSLANFDFLYQRSLGKELKPKEKLGIANAIAEAMLLVRNQRLDPDSFFKLGSMTVAAVDPQDPAAWQPFGASGAARKPARLGLLLCTSVLDLADGKRTLQLTLDFGDSLKVSMATALGLADPGPDPLVTTVEQRKQFAILLHKCLIFSFSTEKGMMIWKLNSDPQIDKDCRSVRFEFVFPSTASPLTPLTNPPANAAFPTDRPTLQIRVGEPTGGMLTHPYELLKPLVLASLRLEVTVEDSKLLRISNEEGILDLKKPFQPFGREPSAGDSFYLAHPALSRSETRSFRLSLQWKGAPRDLAGQYQNYQLVQDRDPKTPLKFYDVSKPEEKVPGLNVYAVASGKETLLGSRVPLFPIVNIEKEGTLMDGTRPTVLQPAFPTRETQVFNPAAAKLLANLPDDPAQWLSYLRIELQSPDLQHRTYSRFLTQRTNLLAAGMVQTPPDTTWNPIILNAPYTPTVRGLTFDYSAAIELAFPPPASSKSELTLYFLEPFGYRPMSPSKVKEKETEKEIWHLLPRLNQVGQLLIGLEDLKPPTALSFLFQMKSGGEDHDGELPELQWHYWCNEAWAPIARSEIVEDSTYGLRQSGIIRLFLPAGATRAGLGLPEACYWLRISVHKHAARFPDCLQVSLQAAEAVLVDVTAAPDHFAQALPAGTVKGLTERDHAIGKVTQPWDSWGGRPSEDPAKLHIRISERLRHKHRALSVWDYEHLVMQDFPEIYKVKCISWRSLPNANPGEVGVFVIPDVRGQYKDQGTVPPAPFADLALRSRIQRHLQKYTPPETRLQVRNPDYIQIQVKAMVNFADDVNPHFYLGQLHRDLAALFSPWAFDAKADVTIGGEIHPTAVAEFIQELDYVDYVLFCKLIQISKCGLDFVSDDQSSKTGGYPVVFVSAPEHNLYQIPESLDPKDITLGIGWVQVGLDFTVS